jgi:hypothetical protein
MSEKPQGDERRRAAELDQQLKQLDAAFEAQKIIDEVIKEKFREAVRGGQKLDQILAEIKTYPKMTAEEKDKLINLIRAPEKEDIDENQLKALLNSGSLNPEERKLVFAKLGINMDEPLKIKKPESTPGADNENEVNPADKANDDDENSSDPDLEQDGSLLQDLMNLPREGVIDLTKQIRVANKLLSDYRRAVYKSGDNKLFENERAELVEFIAQARIDRIKAGFKLIGNAMLLLLEIAANVPEHLHEVMEKIESARLKARERRAVERQRARDERNQRIRRARERVAAVIAQMKLKNSERQSEISENHQDKEFLGQLDAVVNNRRQKSRLALVEVAFKEQRGVAEDELSRKQKDLQEVQVKLDEIKINIDKAGTDDETGQLEKDQQQAEQELAKIEAEAKAAEQKIIDITHNKKR